ncbi:MAG: hypothetical protein LBQ54_15585 [Planctomycetaceae bacterium]|nr:hypothetical protein [Planctomycetaceae bacterium]
MVTLTIDKTGRTSDDNIRWYKGSRRTIYLGGRKFFSRKDDRTVQRSR